MRHKKWLMAALPAAILSACSTDSQAPTEQDPVWPQLDIPVAQKSAMEQRIDELLGEMTLEQKVAQMIQPEIRDITVEDMRKYGFGSYLNGGGAFPNNDKYATPQDWIALAEAMYQASVDDSVDGINIPTMWGTDAVHGHNNVLGATIFPHNIGLGAARNPALIEDIAEVTATEVMVTGIDWVFAPTVAVARDVRWGRTYESYSEDPAVVRDYSASIVRGLQGHVDGDFLSEKNVISTVKHFIGDGGTTDGIDQGNTEVDEQMLFDIHAQGYVGGLEAGAQTVMASFNRWNGEKIHGSKYLLTDVLKEKMGFDGFVVGDWNGHGQIEGCTNDNCPQAANAGLDVYMVPTQAWKPLYENLIAQVKDGTIAESRIDDAVRRILRVKMRAGLFDKPSPANRPLSGKTELIGADEHRAIARQAVRESLVLLKNNNNVLPIKPNQRVLVAGPAADNIGQQSGGWTISWQGTGNSNKDFPGGTSIYDGIADAVKQAGGEAELAVNGEYQEKPDVAVVVYGETPYAEGNGDIDNVDYQRGNAVDLELLKRLKEKGIPVVSVFISGRPMYVNPEMNASDAFVAAWLPGSEGAGVADVLVTDKNGQVRYPMTGQLPFSWPKAPTQGRLNGDEVGYDPLFKLGYGLSFDDNVTIDPLNTDFSGSDMPLEMAIFDRAPQAPWRLMIGNSDERSEVTSSIQSLSGVQTETFDDQVQEDARRFTFAGEGTGYFSFVSPFPRDLRAYSVDGGVLSLTVKADPNQPLTLSLNCGADSCEFSQAIDGYLNDNSAEQWTTLNVSVQCLEQAGVNTASTGEVVRLGSSADTSVSIRDIRLQVADEINGEALCLTGDND
ncbi:exo-1,4-beta-glucosidase [Idiomarina fontislapidosi]|uniref:Beta-glucosidase n=1 Tax=Idiomarina fontislapidosi TaxID=263723 RepID=A0A432Y9A7_9GAMM|nr:exo 1,3/1,4-beta-D-glucan glucohydrolase [Idiomarina fontislapidosi]PYE34473.1 exo-1,4-beta-glucosidase [Idiomarina fontislapidosi]RUO57569.1 beta-glucosidase [Idiomarina fontislapidosi]